MNNNYLEGMRCPSCGAHEPFFIEVTTTFVMFDNGTDQHSDVHWDDNSFCACRCGYDGTVGDFTVPDSPLVVLVEGAFKEA